AARAGEPGVGHDEVDAARLRVERGQARDGGVGVGDVERERVRFAAGGDDGLDLALQALEAARGHPDFDAARGEALGDGEPDAGRRAGHEGPLWLPLHRVSLGGRYRKRPIQARSRYRSRSPYRYPMTAPGALRARVAETGSGSGTGYRRR